jgi:hypothetical protein
MPQQLAHASHHHQRHDTAIAKIRRLVRHGIFENNDTFGFWWSGWSKVHVQHVNKDTHKTIYIVGDMIIQLIITDQRVVFSLQVQSPRYLCWNTIKVSPKSIRDFLLNPHHMQKWLKDRDLRTRMFLKMVLGIKWKKITHEPDKDPILQEDRDAIWEAAPRVPGYSDRFRFDVLGNVVCKGLGSLEYAHPLAADIEHIYPRSLGGRAVQSNFCLLSSRVNRYKGATPLMMCIDERVMNVFLSFHVKVEDVDHVARAERVPLVRGVDTKTGLTAITVDPAWRRR